MPTTIDDAITAALSDHREELEELQALVRRVLDEYRRRTAGFTEKELVRFCVAERVRVRRMLQYAIAEEQAEEAARQEFYAAIRRRRATAST